MAAQRREDTQAELRLRRALHASGLRFRLQVRPIPGVRATVDILLRPARIAIFVDGCFWHVCPEHMTLPRANAEWWLAKLDRNVARDRHVDSLLAAEGWLVVRVWEHEEPKEVAMRIAEMAARRRSVRVPT